MAKYALHADGVVTNVVEADSAWIAANHPTADLLQDETFVSLGFVRNGPGDYEAPPPVVIVPSEVTMRQARLALHAAGLLAGVEAAIEALEEPAKTNARIEWEYSGAVQRHNSFVSVLAPQLGLTEEQTDALFIAASAL